MANSPLGKKELHKSQWRFLKVLFLVATGILFTRSENDFAFTLWGLSLVLALCFCLATKKNPVLAVMGLALVPVTLLLTLCWMGGKRVVTGFYHLARFQIGFVVNSQSVTALPALFVSLFFTAIATALIIRGQPGSGMWAAGLYLTASLGVFAIIQLICLCREPLSPFATYASGIETMLSSYFETLNNRNSFIGMLAHAAIVDRWFKKLAAWTEKDVIFEKMKTMRTRLFVFFWFLLLAVGTVVFTNLFVTLDMTPRPFSFESYVDIYATVLTAITGNLYGNLPAGLSLKLLFGVLCLFQVVTVVLLVLVYSIGVDSDVQRIRKSVAGFTTKSSHLIVSGFERLLRVQGEQRDVVVYDVLPDACEFRLETKGQWLSFEQADKRRNGSAKAVKCRVRTRIPIRADRVIQSEVRFNRSECGAPHFEGKPALAVDQSLFTLPEVSAGLCELEFDSTLPTKDELLCKVALSYCDSVLNGRKKRLLSKRTNSRSGRNVRVENTPTDVEAGRDSSPHTAQA